MFIAEFCGGGFGSKGGAYPIVAVPALLSKKIGRPVMMRISRHEEYYLGSARAGFQGRAKIGFRADGRVTAVDLYIVQENGPNTGFNDWLSAADAVSIVYQPAAMRFRGVPVMTNTPPRGPQRGPGQNQIAMAIEPLIDKAARQLGIDRLEIRRINAPDDKGKIGAMQGGLTSAHLREALEQGAEKFGWEARRARSGQRNGTKVTGVGVGTAFHTAGGNGFDGLVRLAPDGKLYIHTGVGNLGTYSHTATSRVSAEVLKMSWENCVVVRGDSSKHLPWNNGQFGSNTSFTMTRTNFAAATDAVAKLKEIAAKDFGGAPADYDIGNETVFSRTDPAKKLTYAAAAQRAVELGGKFDGHEVPADLNVMTKASAAGVAGTGLIGVAKDNIPRTGTVPALAAGFIEIELDTETGKFTILDYVGVADCGTVLHPMGLSTQIKSGAVMGIGLASSERHIFDPQNGLPGNVGLLAREAAVVPRRAADHDDGRGGHRGPAEPGRREGHRRAGPGVRGGGAARRHLRRARRSLFQPDAGYGGSHRERGGRAGAVAQAFAGQHRMSNVSSLAAAAGAPSMPSETAPEAHPCRLRRRTSMCADGLGRHARRAHGRRKARRVLAAASHAAARTPRAPDPPANRRKPASCCRRSRMPRRARRAKTRRSVMGSAGCLPGSAFHLAFPGFPTPFAKY